jgi:hypothetical protein
VSSIRKLEPVVWEVNTVGLEVTGSLRMEEDREEGCAFRDLSALACEKYGSVYEKTVLRILVGEPKQDIGHGVGRHVRIMLALAQ